MSGFLSNKFLKYRGLPSQAAGNLIDADLNCAGCGYNVRGLFYGRNCPECGQEIQKPRSGQALDVLAGGEWAERSRMLWGLTLALLVLMEILLVRLWAFVGLIFAPLFFSAQAYMWIGAIASAAWGAAMWLLTPARLDRVYPRWWLVRHVVRWSQACWLLSFAFWLASAAKPLGSPQADRLMFYSNVAALPAVIGCVPAAVLLLRLASDANLEDAARRITLTLWTVPILFIVLAGAPSTMPWIFLPILGGFFLAWCWFTFQFARAVLEMRQHVAWTMRLTAQRVDREQRMTEKRRQVDAEVAAQVRPVQTGGRDIRIDS